MCDFFRESNHLLIAVLRRAIFEVADRVETLTTQRERVEDLVLQLIEQSLWSESEFGFFVGHLYIHEAIRGLVRFLISGEPLEEIRLASEALVKASDVFRFIHASGVYSQAKLLRTALPQIANRSIWQGLASFKLAPRQAQYLIRLTQKDKPVWELWRSQAETIKGGILDPAKQRIAVSMPTSSGKTLVAEIAIVQTLTTTDRTCIYVVPTRALAHEIHATLSESLSPLGFTVARAVGAIELNEAEDRIIRDANVVVATPEKLDLLLRRKHPVIMDAGLVVFDEGQNLEDWERGLRLELTAVKVKLALETTKVILLSAVLRNTAEIANWLASGRNGTAIDVTWRPTRPMTGCFHWDGLDGIIEYTDGTRLTVLRKRIRTDPRYSSILKETAELALVYGAQGGVLVLTTRKRRAEDIAHQIGRIADVDASLPIPASLEDIALQIRRELSRDFPLADLVVRGIAYHHADLPPRIRVSIENAVREGLIRYVVSTTTLAEGVNLPISTVIVEDLKFRRRISPTQWRSLPMSPKKFWNIAGRAGRAISDTEGHVILVEPRRRWSDLDLDLYLRCDLRRFEPVISRLVPIMEVILRWLDLRQYPDSFEDERFLLEDEPLISEFQSAILHVLLEGYIDPQDPASIRRFVDETLLAYQVDHHSRPYLRFVDFTAAHVRNVVRKDLLDREFQETVNRTGLSIDSCMRLWQRLRELELQEVTDLLTLRDTEGRFRESAVLRIFRMIFDLREIAPRAEKDHALILLAWISGASLDEISATHFTGAEDEPSPHALEDCSNYIYSSLAFQAPWGLNAFADMVNYLLEHGYVHFPWAQDPLASRLTELVNTRELGYLSLYANFGVNDPVAVELCLLGLERTDATILTSVFRTQITPDLFPEWSTMRSWVLSLSPASLERYLADAGRSYHPYIEQVIAALHQGSSSAPS